jgi:ribosomal protein S18 acetylase RimI-like enzyme
VAEPAMLDAMDAVMQRAYGVSSFRVSIDRFVAAQPDGLVVVEHDGATVGTGCCVAYPDGGFGWIGLVATAPWFERRGIATAITEFLSGVLAGHGCASVLDASAAGGPVYERMGFADRGLTRVLRFDNNTWPGADVVGQCVPLTDRDLDDVVAFDAARFGASRRSVLAKVTEQHPGRALVLRRRGQIVGYLVAQETTLAPVVADDSESLSDLITAALGLDWGSPPRINVPPESGHMATLEVLGFQRGRELRHMRRGIEVLPGRRECIAGVVSLGEG